MANRSVVINVGMNVGGLVASARTGTKALSDMGRKGLDWTGQHEQSINQLTTGLGVFGLAAVAGVGLAVKKFADFDQAMSNVEATGDDARGSIDELRQAALDAGASTVFSATEAAGAVEELAKAGVSAADILGGGLDGALDLAAAGGIEVASAAEIAATAMTQFRLKGTDVVHVADLLAAGAGKAQGGVADMGMALKQAGLVANQTGLSIEETTGGLAAFASAGLLGSDSGTSFKSMLQRLTPQSTEAADEMRRLGISAYDSQGQFIGLADFAGNLQAALKDLTPEQRNAAMATIFGSDAVRAAAILYDEGESGIRKWIAAVDDQGYAAETAATRMDNLKGDIEGFMGALETALIGAGEGANGPLRDLVQGATDVVNAFNGLPDGAKTALLAIIGGGGLVALGVAGLGKLIVGISNTRDSLSNLGVTAGKVGTAMKFAGALGAIGALVYAAKSLGDAFEENVEVGVGAAKKTLAEATTGSDAAQQSLEDLAGAAAFLKDSGAAWTENWGRATEALSGFDGALTEMVSSGDLEGASDQFHQIAGALREQGFSTEEIARLLPGYTDALAGAEAEATTAAPAIGEVGAALDEAALASQAAADSLAAYLDQLRIATDPVFALNDAVLGVTQAQKAYDEVLADNKHTQEEAEQAAFDLAAAVTDLETKALDGELSFDAFSGKLDQWVKQGAITKEQAAAIRSRVEDLTGAAEDYQGNYNSTLTATDRASGTIGSVDQKLDALNGRTVTSVIRTIHQDWYKGSGVPGGLASGTDNWRGGLTWVGEEGPELVSLPRGSQVFTAPESRGIAQAMQSGTVQTMTASSVGASSATTTATARLHPADIESLAAAVARINVSLYADSVKIAESAEKGNYRRRIAGARVS